MRRSSEIAVLRKVSEPIAKQFSSLQAKREQIPRDEGRFRAQRGLKSRMQKLASAEKAYKARMSKSDRRATQSWWKHFTLLQAQVELDRLTIHTETTRMMFHVYALQQENMPIAEDAQVVVTKYITMAADDILNAMIAQHKELSRRINTDPVPRDEQMEKAMNQDRMLYAEQRGHRRRYQVAAMKYVKMYRSVLEGAGVNVPSEIVKVCEDETLQARIQRYETEGAANKRSRQSVGTEHEDNVKKRRITAAISS